MHKKEDFLSYPTFPAAENKKDEPLRLQVRRLWWDFLGHGSTLERKYSLKCFLLFLILDGSKMCPGGGILQDEPSLESSVFFLPYHKMAL